MSEIYNAGNVIKIWAQDYTDDRWFLLWDESIQFELSTSRLFSPPLNPCYFKTNMLKLQFRNNVNYSILDAVMLIGTSKLILPKNSEPSITEIFKKINCKYQFHQETAHNLTANFENAHLDIVNLQENFSEYCIKYQESNVGKDFHESFKHEKVSGKEITCVSDRLALQASTQSLLFYNEYWNIEKCSKYIDLSSDKSEELSHCNLSVLPDEIILKIFKELDLTSLYRMSQVNEWFNNLTQDPCLYTCLNMRNVNSMSFAKIPKNIFSYFTPRCTYLKQLDLTLCTFASKDFVEFLNECGKSLTHLRLSKCDYIDDFALEKISKICKNLKELDLVLDLESYNWISDKGFLHLKNLNNLEFLNLNYEHINPPVLCEILQSNPQMRELYLENRLENAKAVARELRNSCQKLDTINLHSTCITSDGVEALADCKNLRKISIQNFVTGIYGNKSYNAALSKLFSSCQHLEEIHLFMMLTDEHDNNNLVSLTQCKNLKCLLLYNEWEKANNYSIIFDECPKLEEIYFINCKISNCMINEWKEKYPYVSMYVLNQNVSKQNEDY